MDLRRGVDAAIEAANSAIKTSSKKVKTSAEVAQVGSISANGPITNLLKCALGCGMVIFLF